MKKNDWNTAFEKVAALQREIKDWPDDADEPCNLNEVFGRELMKNVTYLPFGLFPSCSDPPIDLIDVSIMMCGISATDIITAVDTAMKSAGIPIRESQTIGYVEWWELEIQQDSGEWELFRLLDGSPEFPTRGLAEELMNSLAKTHEVRMVHVCIKRSVVGGGNGA